VLAERFPGKALFQQSLGWSECRCLGDKHPRQREKHVQRSSGGIILICLRNSQEVNVKRKDGIVEATIGWNLSKDAMEGFGAEKWHDLTYTFKWFLDVGQKRITECSKNFWLKLGFLNLSTKSLLDQITGKKGMEEGRSCTL
jgi:hypothetical protein